jgi:LPXTG-site transpeptidase (sortase) family protein
MQSLLAVIDRVMERKVAFLVAFFVVFTLTYGVFAAFDMLPEPVKTTKPAPEKAVDTVKTVVKTPAQPETPQPETPHTVTPGQGSAHSGAPQNLADKELPTTLIIDALNRTVPILNPASPTVASLDAALLRGVARHPQSATLGQDGNIFILGHSSYLPVVHNKNYQALNGIQNLKWGDTIRIASATTEYTYRVEKVYKAKASALTIPVAEAGKHLTLATCNSCGTHDDRYVVEATLQSTKPI